MLSWTTYNVLLTMLLAFVAEIFCGNERQDLYCGVCKIIAEEVKWDISQVDPRKTLEVESFRIDSKGNQQSKSIPYARSETHLAEILENVCERMNNYAESTKSGTGRKTYVRTSSRDGKGVTLENISMSGEISKALKFACETFVEDHEETIIEIFQNEVEHEMEKLCERQTDVCNEESEEGDDEDHDEDHDEF